MNYNSIVSVEEYNAMKNIFFKKHNNDFECQTEGYSAEHYNKTYMFEDGSTWYESMSREQLVEEIEVKKCKVYVNVDLMRIEFWSSDHSESHYYYEPWDIMFGTH